MKHFRESERPLAVYAHPDDEVIGCTAAIHECRERIRIVYATDGMPTPVTDPEDYVPHTQYEYGPSFRELRKREAQVAMECLGVRRAEQLRHLSFPDSELVHKTDQLATHLRKLISKIKPDLIITHAFEGGHIDHDIVVAAIWKLTAGKGITICETPLYSQDGKGVRHNKPTMRHRDWSTDVHSPSPLLREQKCAAFCAYASQKGDLQYFDPDADEHYHFADSGSGDFTSLETRPNSGEVLYENDTVTFDNYLAAIRSL